MWCTRWFLPLLLLPLPTAPPFFLVLFILSLTMHAKPCFYCIVLLTTLFVSSCYWQPFPIDTPLTTPWSESVSTFSEALNASLPSNYTRALPSVMRAADRCWCDFSGSFFEPFNVSKWEYASVQRVSHDLERQQRPDAAVVKSKQDSKNRLAENNEGTSMSGSVTENTDTGHADTNIWARLLSFHRRGTKAGEGDSASNMLKTSAPEPSNRVTDASARIGQDHITGLPTLRAEYDLRPYGLGVILDFRWSR
ncbi:hypothetical protein CPB83DRAFT_872548 [Crepidotus variabilis]|uniref:Uncharacterized protein n=1 Tax=Crepidotus variabilis TaxID=179855 RepID=A0A9P6EUR8_9AGAR|nr:hypothetical protein CPB83DRAFT_872548 [Crepidotus variabilis]